jgi:hypothetical protein
MVASTEAVRQPWEVEHAASMRRQCDRLIDLCLTARADCGIDAAPMVLLVGCTLVRGVTKELWRGGPRGRVIGDRRHDGTAPVLFRADTLLASLERIRRRHADAG